MAKSLTSKKQPEKSLLVSLKKYAGRNRNGQITVRHRGGGSRKLYRKVEFGQKYLDIPGKVAAIEYDPNRNAHIALVEYENGDKGYVLAAQRVQEGTVILASEKGELVPGSRMKLKNIPVGTLIHNIELIPMRGGKVVRGAGTSARVVTQEEKFTHLVMPSSEVRQVRAEAYASIGAVSNPGHMYKVIGKAGSNRLKGKRPHVRGVAMNPVDHPHGGGEGRGSIGGKYPKTPWGKHALGVKTRKAKKWTNALIVQRRKKKKKK